MNSTHHCIICDGIEDCKEAKCAFSNLLMAHFDCYNSLPSSTKKTYDMIVAELKEVCPKQRKF